MRRLEFTEGWTYHDSRQFYNDSIQEFERIKGNYSGPATRFWLYVSSFRCIDNYTSGHLKPDLAREDLASLVNMNVDLNCLHAGGQLYEEAQDVLHSYGIDRIRPSNEDSDLVRKAKHEMLLNKAPGLSAEITKYMLRFSPKGWEEHGMILHSSFHEAMFGKKSGSR